ncbi:MAG: hypothetical protein JOZ01_03945 [Candidatus Eremiobacteraeota bacterium]|nr:hypothetical protein [Candidatus Eremiobacteraeota bacterium]
MMPLRNHPVNEDEADRHQRTRRVPVLIAIAVAIAVVLALSYLRGAGIR